MYKKKVNVYFLKYELPITINNKKYNTFIKKQLLDIYLFTLFFLYYLFI